MEETKQESLQSMLLSVQCSLALRGVGERPGKKMSINSASHGKIPPILREACGCAARGRFFELNGIFIRMKRMCG